MPGSVWFPGMLALVTLAYLWWKHRKLKTALEGTASSLIGYYLVVLGAQLSPYTLYPMRDLVHAAFGVYGGVINSEVFGAALLSDFGALGFPILIFGFLVNLLLARQTRAKGVYLTGHHFLYMALFTALCLRTFSGLSPLWIMALGSLLLGLWAFGSVSVTALIMRRVTGVPGTGMANSCAGASLLGALSGRLFGNSRDGYDAEPIAGDSGSIPVLAFVGTLIVYLALALIAGPQRATEILGGDKPWILSCLTAAFLYAAQVALLIHGIRSLVSNIVAMFWDLANRLVPDLWVGLDASTLISYSPRAWRAGFWSCTLGGALTMAVIALIRMPFVPLLSLTSYYFVGGVAGICGNVYGGKRGAWLAGLLTGIFATCIIAMVMSYLGQYSKLGAAFGETEYGIYGLFIRWICGLFR